MMVLCQCNYHTSSFSHCGENMDLQAACLTLNKRKRREEGRINLMLSLTWHSYKDLLCALCVTQLAEQPL